MDSNHRLDVVVGCPLVLSQLPMGLAWCWMRTRSLLIVWFATIGDEHPWPLAFQQCVLAEDDGDEVVWNTFNDERFNGPNESMFLKYGVNLTQLTLRFIGVVHLHPSSRRSITACIGFNLSTSFRQGDPVSSLKARVYGLMLLTNHTPC